MLILKKKSADKKAKHAKLPSIQRVKCTDVNVNSMREDILDSFARNLGYKELVCEELMTKN